MIKWLCHLKPSRVFLSYSFRVQFAQLVELFRRYRLDNLALRLVLCGEITDEIASVAQPLL